MKIKRRTFVFAVRCFLTVLLVSLVALVIYGYFFTKLFVISAYDIVGIDATSQKTVTAKLQAESKKKHFGLPLNDKVFTYSSTLISDTVRSIVSDAASIDIRPIGLRTVRIEVTLLVPLFRISETEGLTKDGIIFSTNKDIRAYPRITIASSTVGTRKIDGLIFSELIDDGMTVKEELLSNIDSFSSKVSSVIFPVEYIFVEKTGDIILFNDSKKSKVIFLKDMDPKKAWSTLVSAIDTDPLKTKLVTEKDRLEYIDSRYGNKIFYRFSDMPFQNGNNTAILDHHATTTKVIEVSSSTPRQ